VISHGYGVGFLEEFDWTGTRDPSPYLAVTAALAFHRRLGPERVRDHNHALADRAAARLAEAWGVERPAPTAMLGSMATLPVPLPGEATFEAARALVRRLRDENGIEVFVQPFDRRLWLRVSAQVYNHIEEYDRLARALG
jgi:isopenicillin-N epimerase